MPHRLNATRLWTLVAALCALASLATALPLAKPAATPNAAHVAGGTAGLYQ